MSEPTPPVAAAHPSTAASAHAPAAPSAVAGTRAPAARGHEDARIAPHEAPRGALAAGWRECADGLANWRIAHLDGTAVLRRRYARSRLGQFWLTLSTGISIAALGGVWTLLWKQPAAEIFPYIAVSLVLWNFMSSLVTEGANVFVGHAHTLSNQGMAVSTYVYALLYRGVLVLAHDAVIIVVVVALFHGWVGWQMLLFIPAFALTLVSGFCVIYLTGMLCTRYRDMILFTATAMQLLFYITPVLWKRDFLPPEFAWITHANPFAVYLSILRDPLLGHAVPMETWAFAAMLCAALLLVTLLAAGKVRRRLIYWV
jgi:ABC-type polysaccharide/polyol phosphate export permease